MREIIVAKLTENANSKIVKLRLKFTIPSVLILNSHKPLAENVRGRSAGLFLALRDDV